MLDMILYFFLIFRTKKEKKYKFIYSFIKNIKKALTNKKLSYKKPQVVKAIERLFKKKVISILRE